MSHYKDLLLMFLRLKKAFDKTLIAFIHFEMFDVKNNLIIFHGLQ